MFLPLHNKVSGLTISTDSDFSEGGTLFVTSAVRFCD